MFTGIARKVLDVLANRIATRVATGLLASDELVDTLAYRVRLESLLGAWPAAEPHRTFAGITDAFWYWIHTEGYRRHPGLRAILPGLPAEDIQVKLTGAKGERVLREGFKAYQLFKSAHESHLGPLADDTAILDFGCGWGRIIRFFLKDIEPTALVGVDPLESMVEFCRASNRWCRFQVIRRMPPTPFPDATFDLIYSYSVFSHLSEPVHLEWLLELRRILKPGGLLLLTTRGRDFILFCAALRHDERLTSYPDGIKISARSFTETEHSLAEYDRGRYCFSSHEHTGEWDYWGDTAIPKAYVLDHWAKHLTFLDYVADRSRCDQDVIVMTK